MIVQILKNEFIGIVNLAFPIIMLAQIYPTFLLTPLGQITCSLLVGMYLLYINYTAAKNSVKNLQYSPTGQNKEALEDIIIKCKMNPKNILIRYSYTNEMIATATFNVICLDPILSSATNNDPQALLAKDIIEKQLLVNSPQIVKDKLIKINDILSPLVQDFIFKHELGHVFYNYSYHKLLAVSTIGFIITYIGIFTAIKTFHISTFLAVLLGVMVAAVVDLFLSYSSNVFFKAREEKKADLFAVTYSSNAEVNAAADFFEKLQDIQDADKTSGDLYWKIPSIILSGHYNGKSRAKYLREYSKKLNLGLSSSL